jgi:hypothetical protein
MVDSHGSFARKIIASACRTLHRYLENNYVREKTPVNVVSYCIAHDSVLHVRDSHNWRRGSVGSGRGSTRSRSSSPDSARSTDRRDCPVASASVSTVAGPSLRRERHEFRCRRGVTDSRREEVGECRTRHRFSDSRVAVDRGVRPRRRRRHAVRRGGFTQAHTRRQTTSTSRDPGDHYG